MEKSFTLEVVTPEKMFLKEEISSLVVPATEGYLGVLYNHAPLVTSLQAGVVKYRQEDKLYYLALSGGFMEVNNNKVTILAEAVEKPNEIDLKRAEAAMNRAIKRLEDRHPGLDVAKAELALRRSRARLKTLEYNHSILTKKSK